mmetsp:Transcript_25275/g.79813  ORF Transcript_25275/g.79813 Transcript_25275/m.79813 type:complete len:210 (+) Transcript_25275:482-1111(+)
MSHAALRDGLGARGITHTIRSRIRVIRYSRLGVCPRWLATHSCSLVGHAARFGLRHSMGSLGLGCISSTLQGVATGACQRRIHIDHQELGLGGSPRNLDDGIRHRGGRGGVLIGTGRTRDCNSTQAGKPRPGGCSRGWSLRRREVRQVACDRGGALHLHLLTGRSGSHRRLGDVERPHTFILCPGLGLRQEPRRAGEQCVQHVRILPWL